MRRGMSAVIGSLFLANNSAPVTIPTTNYIRIPQLPTPPLTFTYAPTEPPPVWDKESGEYEAGSRLRVSEGTWNSGH